MEDEKKIFYEDMIQNEEGILIYNPYNPLNIEITPEDIKDILVKYGLPPIITNMELYRRAFIHKSYVKKPIVENIEQNIVIVDKPYNCLALSSKSNERLEFLGDGILELVTKYYLYRRFPKADEGFLTEKKIAIVKNEAIGLIAYEMKLYKWLIISKHAEEKKIRTNLKKLGCLFESFLGAVFLDFNKVSIKDENGWFNNIFIVGPGFQMVQKMIENIFEKHIDWIKLLETDDNYKNILQVKIQKEFKVTPHYLIINQDIEEGFTMGVYLCLGKEIYKYNIKDAITLDNLNNFQYINEYIEKNKGNIFLLMGKGIHKIKRKAEQLACLEALNILQF